MATDATTPALPSSDAAKMEAKERGAQPPPALGPRSWRLRYSALLSTLFIFEEPEERRKCGLLVGTILIFMSYNSAYFCQAFFYPPCLSDVSSSPSVFTGLLAWLLGVAGKAPADSYLTCLASSHFHSALLFYTLFEVFLLTLLYTTRNLYLVAFPLFIFVDAAALTMCLEYGVLTEYLIMLIYIPIFLFYLFGSGVGLAAMGCICGQAFLIFIFTTYVSPPTQLLIFTPTDRLLATMLNYLLVGCTAFVHATSRSSTLHELQCSNVQLQKATKAKAQFLANMSHELRTPLHGILAMAREMADFQLDDAIRECGQIITHCGEHMHALINDVLDFEKIESDQLRLHCAPFSVPDIIHQLVKVIMPSAKKKQVRLTVRMDVAHRVHQGDAGRFRQIVWNLVANGLKFTPEGGEVTLSVSNASESPEQVRVDVIDTGIGIPVDHVPNLFQGFYLVDASITRRHGGSGLGLAICKRLTEAMGGTIGCSSKLNQGSHFRFTVTLPVVPQDPVEGEADSDTTSEGHCEGCSEPDDATVVKGARVLLVEDNVVNQKVGIRALSGLGCDVVLAQHGEHCLNLMESDEQGFDAVLMDCQMPVMDGFEATVRIRERERQLAEAGGDASPSCSERDEHDADERYDSDSDCSSNNNNSPSSSDEEKEAQPQPQVPQPQHQWNGGRTRVPVIALTASVTSEYRHKCFDCGMDDWMAKPFNRDALRRILAKWLRLTRHSPAASRTGDPPDSS